MGQLYKAFWELSVAVVVAVLWLVGLVLAGTCALVLFLMSPWSVFVLL
jgi:hypothetical protein